MDDRKTVKVHPWYLGLHSLWCDGRGGAKGGQDTLQPRLLPNGEPLGLEL